MVTGPQLPASVREHLGDARLLLQTAVHNLRAAENEVGPSQALANALTMSEQALTTLDRVLGRT